MSTKCDAEQIQNNTFVSPEEKTDFETLVASGTRLYLWTVPSEVKQEITTLYRKVKE